jgi:hypothetical protein
MPVRVGKLMREAMGNYARRIAAGEQLKPRLNRLLHAHKKLLRELVRERLLSNQKRRGPSELTMSWASHFSNPQYSVEAEKLLSTK